MHRYLRYVALAAVCLLSVALASPTTREILRSAAGNIVPPLRGLDPIPIAVRLPAGFAPGQPVHIRIYKEEGVLEVWMKRGETFEPARTYAICSWSGELGPKLREGDGQSPEGFYEVGLAQLNPRSAYWRAFDLGFPNAYDKALGRTGSFLMVHGNCVSVGCYAMTDAGIDDIYRLVEAALRNGQPSVPVHIFPFRMNPANLSRHAGAEWAGFWEDLAQGERLFEETRLPPRAFACNGRYLLARPDRPAPAHCKAIAAR